MNYNFDKEINRENTNCIKYDLREKVFNTKNDIIPMWVADMDLASPDFVKDAIKQRADHEIYGYSYRPETYYNVITDWLKNRYNWEINPRNIAYSPGVVPGLALTVMAFSKIGDNIIVQPPVYFPFFTTIKENGRQITENNLINTNGYYTIDFDDLKSKINARTSMIIISNLHNPVGRAWKKNELKELGEICVKNDIIIISDEIHSDIVFVPNKHIPMASISEEIADKTITFMAPSKTFNLAGLSSSFAVITNRKLKKIYNSFLENYHLNLGNIFGNVATEAAYTHGIVWVDEMKNYIESNIDFTQSFLKEHIPKITFVKPEATYLLWLDFTKLNMNENELNDFLINKANIGLNKGSVFGNGGDGYMRMNLACTRKTLEKALNQLKEVL
jgi:cystathionine beta-lyase